MIPDQFPDIEGEIEMVEFDVFAVNIIPVFHQFGHICFCATVIRHILTFHELIRFNLRKQISRQFEIFVDVSLTVYFWILEIIPIIYGLVYGTSYHY